MTRRIAIALALLACAAPAAHASRTQESTFQDDNHLIYTTPDEAARTMDQLKALGADRLRITVLWSAIAPDLGSKTKPAGFDGADPGAYPSGVWNNYDTVVRLAFGVWMWTGATSPGL